MNCQGLFRVASGGEKLEKPYPLLMMPAKVGTKWEVEDGSQFAVIKEEQIEVPAGKFQTIRVERVIGDSKTTIWFAPNIGLIKMSAEGRERVQVLKEFKAGK